MHVGMHVCIYVRVQEQIRPTCVSGTGDLGMGARSSRGHDETDKGEKRERVRSTAVVYLLENIPGNEWTTRGSVMTAS